MLFFDSGGLSKSLYRAKYYLEEAAGKGVDEAYYCLVMNLLELSGLQYKGMEGIPGHNCIPGVIFWAPKAVVNEMFKPETIKLIEELERFAKQSYVNCERDAECFSKIHIDQLFVGRLYLAK